MIDCGCDEILLPQGSDGVNGKNAYTVTTASFVQPAVGVAVTITVSDTLQSTNQWAIVGQIIRVTDSAGRGGWYQVTAITGTTQITATNLDYQPGSSPQGTTIAAGAGVSPAGIKGVDGAAGTTGAQGPVGDPNTLSVDPVVALLAPGSIPTVGISGSSPNQVLTFGIPQGFPGADGSGTLRWQYNSTTEINVTSIGPTALIPSSSIGTSSELCPNDGDAFRATFFCSVRTSLASHNGFYTQIQLSDGTTNNTIEYITSNTTFNNSVNMFSIIPILGSGSSSAPLGSLKFDMIVHRLTATTARVFVEWTSNQGFNNIKTGSYSIELAYNFNNSLTKSIQVNAGTTSGQTTVFSRFGMLVEKITA